jgi:hypothetical protein
MVQRVEDGNAVRTAHRGLAVDRERLGRQLRRGARDRRVSIGPVIAPPEPHDIAVTADDQPVTAVLDLVDPAGPGRRLGGAHGNPGLNEAVWAGRNHVLLTVSSLRPGTVTVSQNVPQQEAIDGEAQNA